MADALRRAAGALASRRFATALMAAWALLLLVWMLPFHLYGLPVAQLKRIIYDEPFFRVIYVGMVVSTLGCILPRIGMAWRLTRRVPDASLQPRASKNPCFVRASWSDEAAADALRAVGYRKIVRGEGWVWGVAHRYSPLGNILSHIAILALMAAFLVSVTPGAETSTKEVLAVGESYDPAVAATDSSTDTARVPVPAFKVVDIQPAFYRDILLFTQLEGVLESGGRNRSISLANPWHPDPVTTVALADFGYAPEITYESADATAVTSVFKVKVFPSGTSDTFDIVVRNDRYRVEMSVFSDYVERNGVPASRSFNLRQPRLKLSVWRVLTNEVEKLRVDQVLVAPGEPLRFDGVTMTVNAVRYYGVFSLSRSLAAPLFAIALACMVAGVTMRLVLPRRQALISDADGTMTVSVIVDTYRRVKLFEERLVRSIESEDDHA